jgi:hypothetical protein
VDVPIGGRQVAIVVPTGFLPVRISSADTNEPISRATITWTSEGARVEALSSVIGEAMLEGVGTTGGTLTADASGYKPANETLLETLPVLHEVALTRAATSHVQVRVVTASGVAVPDAVVELFCADPMEIPRIATTDSRGNLVFADAPSGSLRLTASAEGYVTATVTLKDDRRSELTLVPTTR